MSSYDRRRLILALAAAPLAGCGFRPAFAPGGPAADLFDSVAIDPPTDKNGFDLVERLEERLGRTRSPAYRLSYRIDTKVTQLAITSSNAITRYNIAGSVSYALRDRADRMVSEGKVTNFTAYSATGTPVSTAAAEADAYKRLMTVLADAIVTRLIAARAAQTGP